MNDCFDIQTGTFNHLVLRGSSHEVGAQLVHALEKTPAYLNFFRSGQADARRLGYANFAALEESFERACPGVVDEVHGFAAAAGVRPEQVIFYQMSSLVKSNCSQMAALPAITADGHVLVGRSYEWNPREDDLCLMTTSVTGRARHLGFSCLLLGRMDGFNEHGLSVTMSGGMAAGLPPEWTHCTGPQFWVVMRGLLENCATVGEALERLRENVPASNTNILLADRAGGAALAEMARGEIEVLEIPAGGREALLVSTNHYVLAGMAGLNRHEFILRNSVPRRAAITAALQGEAPRVTRETLRTILGREVPGGCFGPYYNEGFGTLWSEIFDLTELEAEVCFGAPGFNPWRRFDLETPEELVIEAKFPQRVSQPV